MPLPTSRFARDPASFATIYMVGIFGVGALAIPSLTGSAAYALAETFGWRQGLGEKVSGAHHFYAAVALSTALGIVLDFAHVNPVRALFLTAVVNGVLAPFLLVAILIVACDDKGSLAPRSRAGRLASPPSSYSRRQSRCSRSETSPTSSTTARAARAPHWTVQFGGCNLE